MENLLKSPLFWQLTTLFPGTGFISVKDKSMLTRIPLDNLPNVDSNHLKINNKDFLKFVNQKGFNSGLYVHYPFCNRICKFCMFGGIHRKECDDIINFNRDFGKLCKKEFLLQVNALFSLYKRNKRGPLSINLLRILHPNLSKDGFLELFRPRLVHLGGGTPNLLGITGIRKLLQGFKALYGNDFFKKTYFEVELSPEDENVEDLTEYLKDNGCDRISLGIQTLNELSGKYLRGRKNTKKVWKLLRFLKDRAPIPLVHMDLLYGLPTLPISESLKDIQMLIGFLKDSEKVRFSFDIGRYIVSPRNYRMGNFDFLDNHAGIWETFYMLNTAIRMAKNANFFVRNGDFDYKVRIFSKKLKADDISTPATYEYYYCMPTLYGALIGVGPKAKSLIGTSSLITPLWYGNWDWQGWYKVLKGRKNEKEFLYSVYNPPSSKELNSFATNLLLLHHIIIRFLYYNNSVPYPITNMLPNRENKFILKILNILSNNGFFRKTKEGFSLPLGYNFLIPLISLLFVPYYYLKGKKVDFGFIELTLNDFENFHIGDKITKESTEIKVAIAYGLQREILKENK